MSKILARLVIVVAGVIVLSPGWVVIAFPFLVEGASLVNDVNNFGVVLDFFAFFDWIVYMFAIGTWAYKKSGWFK